MALEVIYGEMRNRQASDALVRTLEGAVSVGTVYLGYPVLATADARVEVDALLVSRDHGLVAFLLPFELPTSGEDLEQIVSDQDRLYAVLEGNLRRHETLRDGRNLAITIHTATVFPSTPAGISSTDGFYGSFEELADWLADRGGISEEHLRRLQAALQRVATIKPPKKRVSVTKPQSRGAILKEIERGIANLDQWQKVAAIESPEGPQRIRGLAGSGKTVVLALKAAYWHARHPTWRIALTFHSRALYQQIDDLVTRFAFETISDKPDPENLRILHSWGSRNKPGMYSTFAAALGEVPRDWAYARGKYGMDGAFRGICQELLSLAEEFRNLEPIFDAVLIDEAQDLPPEFFQLVYLFTKEPKRIVWGYDELQKLSEAAMPTTDELFGTDPGGESRISLASPPNGPRRDIVLPVCYRNTPWALATAHALGIGVYRKEGGLLQHPDEPQLWQDIGYEVVHGKLASGSRVTLQRSKASYPEYFETLLSSQDAVVVESFIDEDEQDIWVADEIRRNLDEDELDFDDILIVLPDTYRAKSRAPRLMSYLRRRDIVSHHVGVTTTADAIFREDSVAIAHIFRAKGNEAPMVYVVDAQYGYSDFNAVTRRNTLFTAITRSRAWVRIVGWGDRMTAVAGEVKKVTDSDFKLKFKVPTPAELTKMRHLHRDLTESEEATIRKATEGLTVFLEAVERGELDLRDVPPALRTKLIAQITGDTESDDE